MTMTKVPRVLAEQVPGMTYRQLDYWSRVGYLKPHDRPRHVGHDGMTRGGGSGDRRTWPLEEIRVMRRMVRLVSVGLSAQMAATIARRGPGRYYLGEGVYLELGEDPA